MIEAVISGLGFGLVLTFLTGPVFFALIKINLPMVDGGEDGITWTWTVWLLDGIVEFDGMSVVFKDESLEFELSSMTRRVGQDGDNSCDG